MGLFSWYKKRRSKNSNVETKPLKTERVGIGWRLAKSGLKTYTVRVGMLYDQKAIRHFELSIKASSRDRAAYLVKEKLSFEVLSVVQDKNVNKEKK